MQGFCLSLYRRRIEIRRGLGTRQVTPQLDKITAKKGVDRGMIWLYRVVLRIRL